MSLHCRPFEIERIGSIKTAAGGVRLDLKHDRKGTGLGPHLELKVSKGYCRETKPG